MLATLLHPGDLSLLHLLLLLLIGVGLPALAVFGLAFAVYTIVSARRRKAGGANPEGGE